MGYVVQTGAPRYILESMKNITGYFGFATVGLSIGTLLIAGTIQAPDWSEPLSQFGVYDTTQVLFRCMAVVVALTWYLFAKHLNVYWKYTSRTTLLAGIFFILIGWTPYQPYTRNFVFDAHNAAVILAAVFYMLPLWFIGYKKAHQKIAQISHTLFFITLGLIVLSLFARLFDVGIIYAQIFALLPAQIWLVITNTLLLQERREITVDHRAKL